MTVQEIKQKYLMADVLSMYGMKVNRAGFCPCPFHGKDKHPSMRVYKDNFHCYTCNEDGDIFTFVIKMDNCSFKDAFLKFGGEYEKKSTWERKRFQEQQRLLKEKKEREIAQKKKLRKEVIADIPMQRLFMNYFKPFSNDWCSAVNQFEKDMAILELTSGRSEKN